MFFLKMLYRKNYFFGKSIKNILLKLIYIKSDAELLSLHVIQVYNASNRKKEKTIVFCSSLPIKQAHYESCISDRGWNTAGFVTQVVPTPIKYEFLQAVGEWRCSIHGPVATTWVWRGKICACCCSWRKNKHTQEMRATKLTCI